MRKTHESTTKRSVLCVEIQVGNHKADAPITCVLSIPGREGAIQRAWGEPGKPLDEAAARDLAAWLNLTVRQLVLSTHGIQQFLGFEA